MRLIDADKLPIDIEHEDVDDAPTIDAVEVVRCKDCKWAEVDAWWTYCKLGHAEDTPNSTIYTCAYDFFCADGEVATVKNGDSKDCGDVKQCNQ